MVTRSNLTFSQVYPYGADGSARYQRKAAPSARQRTRPATGARTRSQSLSLPLWLVIVAIGVLVAVGCFMTVDMIGERTGLSKDVSKLQSNLSEIEERIGLLEIDIAQASDPSAIHTSAVNVLGMGLPTEDRIITITLPPS
ncbi:MAG: hypothetical protein LBN04_06880 [Oscillospiraceae bacterium]|jgi:hypothetical protein|nr:hypothetical protein [Oscillospiraceae bacterium]